MLLQSITVFKLLTSLQTNSYVTSTTERHVWPRSGAYQQQIYFLLSYSWLFTVIHRITVHCSHSWVSAEGLRVEGVARVGVLPPLNPKENKNNNCIHMGGLFLCMGVFSLCVFFYSVLFHNVGGIFLFIRAFFAMSGDFFPLRPILRADF